MDGGDDSPRGCRGSKRLPRIDLEREEHVRDEWLVLDLCGMVIAILTVLSGGLFANPISDDCSRQKETDETAAWRRPMKNELKDHEKVFQIRTAWNPVANGVACGREVGKNRLDGSAVHPVGVKARPSIVRRQSEL